MPDIAVKQDTAPATKLEGVRHPLLSLREEVNRLFDDFFQWLLAAALRPGSRGP
jgi:hypothetical protein